MKRLSLFWLLRAQIVAVAPALESAGEATRVTAYTSDLIELVSGVPPVRPAEPPLPRNPLLH